MYVLGVGVLIGVSTPVVADCQDEVDELREKISNKEDDCSGEAQREAKRHMASAELNRVNLLNCREDLREARQALRECHKD